MHRQIPVKGYWCYWQQWWVENEEIAVCVSAHVCTDDLLCDSDYNGLCSEGVLPKWWPQDHFKL